jgi:pimeloyl-ACP methyl ester carboxylesterase
MTTDSAIDIAEEVVRFGLNQRLTGVVTRPLSDPKRAVGVVVVSAGLVHRIGPFRVHVMRARALAARGFSVLRFDQSGVGESARGDELSSQSRVIDIKAAVDLLQQQAGVERCIIFGICSGADDIMQVIPEEPRLAGAFLLDGPAWRDVRYHLRYLLPRLLSATKWVNWMRNRRSPTASVDNYRDFPSRDVARQTVDDLVARGARLLFLYTGGAYEYFNHRGQFAHSYGKSARSPLVRFEYWPDCDHTFFAATDRDRLIELTLQWMVQEFA